MSQEMCHVNDDRLEQYAMDRLSGGELETFEEHLLICHPCQLRLDETDIYIHAMRRSLTALRNAPASQSMWDRLQDRIGGLRTPTWVSTWTPTWASAPAFAGALAIVALVVGISTQWPRPGATTLSEEFATVRLEAMKGEAGNSVANRPLMLLLDGRGLPAASRYRWRIVDQRGKPVREGIAASDSPDQVLRAAVPKPLGAGPYFVRIFANETGSEQVREFGLRVR